jgi:hypothetical protein
MRVHESSRKGVVLHLLLFRSLCNCIFKIFLLSEEKLFTKYHAMVQLREDVQPEMESAVGQSLFLQNTYLLFSSMYIHGDNENTGKWLSVMT